MIGRFTPVRVPRTLFGAVLLWFGCFGFDCRSALGANITAVSALITTNVAAAVAGGNGDVGMGVESAANIMALDFIPLGVEDYDFAIPTEYLGMNEVKEFIEVLKSEAFRVELDKLGGYLIKNPGEIIRNISR